MTSGNTQQILKILENGPKSSSEIMARLTEKISQPTFSRLIRNMREKVLRFGKLKSTVYALPREIDGVTTPLPLYEISEDGTSQLIGELWPVLPQGFFLDTETWKSQRGFHEDIPSFLQHLRPSGFLGREIPLLHPEISPQKNIRLWSDNTCLVYASQLAFDAPGNLILGDRSFQIFLSQIQENKTGITEPKREEHYLTQAESKMKTTQSGSSADGEQPKFLCTLEEKGHVLVKFSPPAQDPLAQRVADLLICEHIALRTLKENSEGLPVSHSEILSVGNRVFLESQRFDRVGRWGRKGLLSLAHLASEHLGLEHSWANTAQRLSELGVLSKDCCSKIFFAEAYGHLIANSDMHLHNLSFFTKKGRVTELAPIYDMLPMLHMPRHNQLPNVPFEIPLPQPRAGAAWRTAFPLALQFWKSVCESTKVSENYRTLAHSCLKKVEAQERLIRSLPE